MPSGKKTVQPTAVGEVEGAVGGGLFDQGTGAARLTALEEQMGEMAAALTDIGSYIRDQPMSALSTQKSEKEHSASSGLAATSTSDAKHFARPREFDGSVPWVSYKSQFEAIAAVHGWKDSDRVGELVACLKGPALEVFTHLPSADQLQYERLVAALEQRFGQTNQSLWFRSQFRRRTRNPGESLPALAQDLERLASLAYPNAVQSLKDSLATEQFLDGLADVELQIAARQSRPANLQEALASAIEIEAIRKSAEIGTAGESGFTARQVHTAQSQAQPTNSDQQVCSTNELLQAILHRISVLEASVASPASSNRGRQFTGRRQTWNTSDRPVQGACWHCGQTGHFRRVCPQRRAQGLKSSSQFNNAGN